MSLVVFIRVITFSPRARTGDLGVSVPCHQPRMLNVIWIVHLGKANGSQFKGDDKFYLWMSMDQNEAHQAFFGMAGVPDKCVGSRTMIQPIKQAHLLEGWFSALFPKLAGQV